jgi:hypothetical protein
VIKYCVIAVKHNLIALSQLRNWAFISLLNAKDTEVCSIPTSRAILRSVQTDSENEMRNKTYGTGREKMAR